MVWCSKIKQKAFEGRCHDLALSPNKFPMMMIIAFITIKSSSVPLIEGLCAQIYFRFEISVVCSHLLRVMSPKRDGAGHTSEKRSVETYAYIHITYILPNACRQQVSRRTILSRTSSCRRMGATLNSPTKGRVEVLKLSCCDTTIKWRYPFLTGPERGFESDSCK